MWIRLTVERADLALVEEMLTGQAEELARRRDAVRPARPIDEEHARRVQGAAVPEITQRGERRAPHGLDDTDECLRAGVGHDEARTIRRRKELRSHLRRC